MTHQKSSFGYWNPYKFVSRSVSDQDAHHHTIFGIDEPAYTGYEALNLFLENVCL